MVTASKDLVQNAILASLIEEGDRHIYGTFSVLQHRLEGVTNVVKSRVYHQHEQLERGGLIIPTGEIYGRDSRLFRYTDAGRTQCLSWVERPRDPSRESAVDWLRMRLRVAPQLSLPRLEWMLDEIERDVLDEQKMRRLLPPSADLSRRLLSELDHRLATAISNFVDDGRDIIE